MAMAAANNTAGPVFEDGEWSPSDVALVKSLIINHNNNNATSDGAGTLNNKHKNIVDILHAQFPWKERYQVTDLYVDVVVEMVQDQDKTVVAPPAAGGIELVNDNFGVVPPTPPAVEVVPAMDNLEEVLLGPVNNEVDTGRQAQAQATRTTERQPPWYPHVSHPERQKGRFWTTEEHK
jgi:hypothetical protein